MFSIMFRANGPVHISYLDKGKTITHQSYIKDFLVPMVSNINNERLVYGCKNLKFHHYNARPHIQKNVLNYLDKQGFILMEHPPNSPDLVPCDFWLFDYIKQRLTDAPDAESLETQITKILEDIPKKEYKKTFEKWIERIINNYIFQIINFIHI